MKLNVYEYTIRDSKVGKYTGSYTIKAGCEKEKELQNQFKSHKVDSFDFEYNPTEAPKKEFEIVYLK